jgi:hypothetical protein
MLARSKKSMRDWWARFARGIGTPRLPVGKATSPRLHDGQVASVD